MPGAFTTWSWLVPIITTFACLWAVSQFNAGKEKLLEISGYKSDHDGDLVKIFWSPNDWREFFTKAGAQGRELLTWTWIVPDFIFPMAYALFWESLTQNLFLSSAWWTRVVMFASAVDLFENAVGVTLTNMVLADFTFNTLVSLKNYLKVFKFLLYTIGSGIGFLGIFVFAYRKVFGHPMATKKKLN